LFNTLHSNAEEATEMDPSTLNSENMKVRWISTINTTTYLIPTHYHLPGEFRKQGYLHTHSSW